MTKQREILFRGKRIDNGEWIYGNLLRTDDDGICIIQNHVPHHLLKNYEIAHATVGQYTGLTDKNGRKIFEGDVVKVTDDYGNSDGYDCGYGDISVFDGLWYVAGTVHNALYNINKCRYIEVIGNIHDNPELMGGAEHE